MGRTFRAGILRGALLAGAFAAALLSIPGQAPARDPGTMTVRRIRIGRLEPFTNRFVPLPRGRRTSAWRDSVVQVEFTRAVDIETVNPRTLQVGTLATEWPTEGDYRIHAVYRWKYPDYGYVLARVHPRRVIFDPLGRSMDAPDKYPYGLFPDAYYEVYVPGSDVGATRTVKDLEGRHVRRSATRVFQTGEEFVGP